MKPHQPHQPHPAAALGFTAAIGVITIILVLAALGLQHATAPAPVAASAPASEFSSARAMVHLRQIAQEAHPTGTPQNAQVRTYLVAQLKALGLDAHVQTAFGMFRTRSGGSVGMVHNIVVRLPGSGSANARDAAAAKALMLVAHYDSVHTGPGAADDGASVAAILETLRALRTGPALQNDLICLFTDGEEAGLLGAEAFVAEHPWVKDVALAVNFEYRGNSGPAIMFETSPGNGKLVEGWASAAPHAQGNSLLYEVYKHLPNDTDMSAFKRAGLSGMNFAAIEGHTAYHTSLDRPELMSEASLQHQGETMLALARHFGTTSLGNLQSDNAVYFDLPGLGLLHYPVTWVLPLTVGTLLLFALVGAHLVRTGQLRWKRTLLAMPTFFAMVALVAASCQVLWTGIVLLHPGYASIAQGTTYNSHWYLLAFPALTIALFAALQSALRRWITGLELALAAAGCWVVQLVVVSIAVPGVSFLFTWPLIPILLSLAVVSRQASKSANTQRATWILLIGAAPSIVLLAPMLRALYIGLTPNKVFVMGIALALLLGVLATLTSLLMRRNLLAKLSLAAGVLFLCAGAWTSGFDAEHPRQNNLFYIAGAGPGNAYWLSSDERLDAWTQGFFPGVAQRRRMPEFFGERRWEVWAAPAPDLGLVAPRIDVLQDQTLAGVRSIALRIMSQRQAPSFAVSVEGTAVLRADVQGRALSTQAQTDWTLSTYGMADTGLRLDIAVKPDTKFKVRVRDRTYGLPSSGVTARPDNAIAQPFGSSDTQQAVRVLEF